MKTHKPECVETFAKNHQMMGDYSCTCDTILEKEKDYDRFITEGLYAGFTDPQVNFLERWLFDKSNEE